MKQAYQQDTVDIIASVFPCIVKFTNGVSLATTCKRLAKFARSTHPKLYDLWGSRNMHMALASLEWVHPFVYCDRHNALHMYINMMDVRFVANIKILKDPDDNSMCLDITLSCQTKCSEDIEDDDFVEWYQKENMPVDVPKHKIRQTLFAIFRDVYHTVREDCLAFLQKYPKRVAGRTSRKDMNAEAWEIVASKWRTHEYDERVQSDKVAILSLQDNFHAFEIA